MFDSELLQSDPGEFPKDLPVESPGGVVGDAPEVYGIPRDLDEMVPGPYLGAILSGLDHSRLSGYDLVVVLRAQSRMAAHYQALAYQSVAEVSQRTDPELGRSEEMYEFAADEIRCALNLTRRSADTELGLAVDLRQRLPAVWEALHSGQIDLRRARVIIDGTGHLPEVEARNVVDQIIEAAPRLTTGELRARIRRLCVEIDPDEAKSRYQLGLEQRRVWSEVNPDGTANLMGLQLPVDRVSVVNRRINHLARGLKSSSETRTMDQLRADVFLDLLCGSNQGRNHKTGSGSIDIQVDLTTLAGMDDKAGDLAGMGPVIADIARQVVAEQTNTEWSFTVTDQGRPVATGTTRRRPTASISRQVRARYAKCVFPGCRMPARDCDLDHRQRRTDGGPTTTRNTGPLCRHDHRAKDDGGWDLQQTPGGDHIWTSPLGHTYTKQIRAP